MLTWRNIRTGLIATALVVAMLQIAFYARGVIKQIEVLSSAQTDNMQWTLSQVEVEYLQFRNALYGALADQTSTNEIRKRFDIFYSRSNSVEQADAYAAYRNKSAFKVHLMDVTDFLTETVPVIDSTDQVLIAALPELIARTEQLEHSTRWLALSGLRIQASQADMLRDDMRRLVLQMILAMLLMIGGLVALVLVMRVLNARLRDAVGDNLNTTARLQAMVRAALDGIVVFDQDGRVLEYNAAAETIFGDRLKRPAISNIRDLLLNDNGDTFGHPKSSQLLGKGRFKAIGRRHKKETFPVEVAVARTRLKEFDDVFIAYIRDISDQLNAETALLKARDEAQAGEKAKANLLAVMSHEIRTPLNGMLGAAELLRDTELTKKQQSLLEAMETSGNVLLGHVNDILDISRLDAEQSPSNAVEFDVRALISELVDSQRANALREQNTLSVSVADSVPEFAKGAPRKLQQALLNLIGNAVKFTKGGQIIIEVDHFGHGDVIEFRVIDTGIGIAEPELERIFEDFFAIDTTYGREQHGTGLGLSITRRLVKSMGGDIGAESLVHEGSLFWFRVPLPPVDVAIEKSGAFGEMIPTSESLSVLLVEDNEINRMITGDMLTKAGHRVTEATDGGAGVIKAEMTQFDVILMDISMPGMDGITAAKKIRCGVGRSSQTPIIALTAQTLSDDLNQIKSAGFDNILSKPITAAALNTVVAQHGSARQPMKLDSPQADVMDDGLLREDILSDVVANIGLDNALHHHSQLQEQIHPVLKQLHRADKAEQAPMSDVHAICGAAAVLGLCALHRHLSELEALPPDTNGAIWNSWANRTQAMWEQSNAAILAYLKQWSSSKNQSKSA